MRKMITTIIAIGFLANFTWAKAQEPEISMGTSPSNVIIGKPITVSAKVTGGVGVTYKWEDPSGELSSQLADVKTSSVTVVYDMAGMKSLTVTINSENHWVARTLTFQIFEGKMTMISPNGGEVYKIGRNYVIKWKTEGNIPFVQIGFYNPKNQDLGVRLVAEIAPNTGSFTYTVPADAPLGDGFVMYVAGFYPSVPGVSKNPFSIRR